MQSFCGSYQTVVETLCAIKTMARILGYELTKTSPTLLKDLLTYQAIDPLNREPLILWLP